MSDKAEKLQNLIVKMMGTVTGLDVPKLGPANGLLLWQAFEPLAIAMEQPNYAEFRDNYLSLCSSVRTELETLELGKESVRLGWIGCINRVSSVFDASNFGLPTHHVFAAHFDSVALSTLDMISERLQKSGYQDSTGDELTEAMDAVRAAIAEFEGSGQLPTGVANLLKAYLAQMEKTYQLSQDFGDALFWQAYKVTFSGFIQIMKFVEDADNNGEIKAKLKSMAGILSSKAVAGISLTANVATIGSAVVQLLT